ncbi:MAG: hypothetical protein Q9M22_01125 [Mariprofundaceae bacterium]|nr:hypothetical protein [Mariprofundaceae bacterium]
MRHLLVSLLLIALSWATWMVWVSPQQAPTPAAVDVYITAPPASTDGLWRVLTHRMVWKQGVHDLQRKLASIGLTPQLITRKERVKLYTFDDARTFISVASARGAQAAWQQHGIMDVDVVVKNSGYGLGLGRYYIMEFARNTEQRLRRSGLPYKRDKRVVRIPAMRFVFPPMSRPKADTLWQKLQALGVGKPIIIRDEEFKRRYMQSEHKSG